MSNSVREYHLKIYFILFVKIKEEYTIIDQDLKNN